MTVLTAPPRDHAPRLASARPEDFERPHGREEEWRFTPMEAIEPFLSTDPEAGCLTAEPSAHVTVVPMPERPATAWLPTDLPSAIAFSGAESAVQVDIAADEHVVEPIVVDLRGSRSRNYGHVDVRIGRHAKAVVVIVHDLTVDASGSIVTSIADGADLTMLSIADGPAESTHVWQWHTEVGRDARFVGSVVTIGGRVFRMLPSIGFAGPGGSAELLGAFLADDGQFVEHRIFVDHDQPHCTSNVVFKGALAGRGTHTVWIGDVLVRRTAIGTDTYEMNRNLILDEGARADSVPNLELETGDVASAGHASATGRFDDEQLFYLQARGLPERLARQLVVRGFFVDVLARFPSPQWRATILHRIAQRLGMDDDLEHDLTSVELDPVGAESAS